jgi:hypothetical protein
MPARAALLPLLLAAAALAAAHGAAAVRPGGGARRALLQGVRHQGEGSRGGRGRRTRAHWVGPLGAPADQPPRRPRRRLLRARRAVSDR